MFGGNHRFHATGFRTSGKDNDLFDIPHLHFGKTINKTKIRFMTMKSSGFGLK